MATVAVTPFFSLNRHTDVSGRGVNFVMNLSFIKETFQFQLVCDTDESLYNCCFQPQRTTSVLLMTTQLLWPWFCMEVAATHCGSSRLVAASSSSFCRFMARGNQTENRKTWFKRSWIIFMILSLVLYQHNINISFLKVLFVRCVDSQLVNPTYNPQYLTASVFNKLGLRLKNQLFFKIGSLNTTCLSE